METVLENLAAGRAKKRLPTPRGGMGSLEGDRGVSLPPGATGAYAWRARGAPPSERSTIRRTVGFALAR